MSKTQDSQPAATAPATTYETHLARVIAATSDLAAEIEALQVAARATGRLAPKGLGPARGLHRAIVQARTGWKMIDPTLVGLPPVDQRTEALREAERAVKLAEERLKWARDLPHEAIVGSKESFVKRFEDEARAARNGLHIRKDEPLEEGPAVDRGGGFTLPEWAKRTRREAPPMPMAKDIEP